MIRTKTELYDYLRRKPGAFIFLNGDNEHLVPHAEGLTRELYGETGHGYQVEGEVVECNPALKFRFRLSGGEWHTVQTHLIGAYNLTNALAAITVGVHFGITPEQAARAIEGYIPSNNRSEYMRTAHNELIVDAYNANPTSMKAAIDNFALINHPHKMLILGEMRELGTESSAAHRKVAAHAASLHAEAVWLVGEEFRQFAEGMRWFPDVEAVKTAIADGFAPLDRLILIKGSNGTKLFELPALL